MKKSSLSILALAALFAPWLAGPSSAQAQALRPNILIIFDTSGSMADNDVWNIWPRVDGSPLCGGVGTDRRIFLLKKALRETLAQVGTDEANFGLMRYPQKENANAAPVCPRGRYFNDASTDTGCRLSTHNAGQTSYEPWFDSAYREAIVVPVTNKAKVGKPAAGDFDPSDGNVAELLRWINLSEAAAGGVITDPEIRAGGQGTGNTPETGFRTPLGRSLFYARLYFDNYVRPTDPRAQCRKNVIIFVTDGVEKCDEDVNSAFNPQTQAQALFGTSKIPVYVLTEKSLIAAANNPLDPIAAKGGTTKAIGVDLTDSNEIKQELLGIIAQTVPPGEICNGIDDDCDGLTDELPLPGVGQGCTCNGQVTEAQSGKGMCMLGVTECSMGVVSCQGCKGPATEICDGIDNNCNGQIDEGFDLGAACNNGLKGACFRAGTKICTANGMGTMCDAPVVQGVSELCNKLDDDCDGMTDEPPDGATKLPGEGEVCGVGIGQCSSGMYECKNGALVCNQIDNRQTEVCDALDNDCNGQTDEGLGGGECACDPYTVAQLKMGECKAGALVCKGGLGIKCEGCVPPRAETCDGKDNNCDGVTDEGEMICPNNWICVKKPASSGVLAKCEPPCSGQEFPCPLGFECTAANRSLDNSNANVCLSTKCRFVSCMPGFRCNSGSGVCEDPCAGVTCAAPQQCLEGVCKDCRSAPSLCKANEICLAGQCAADPCADKNCPKGQYCQDGQCINDCNGLCLPNQRCVSGVCEADGCAQANCPDGQVCDPSNGACKVNACLLQTCPGQVCVPLTGSCKDDPCRTVKCPAGCYSCDLTADGLAQCRLRNDCVDNTVTKGIKVAGGGCSCRVAQARNGEPGGWVMLLAFGFFTAWRRRRR